MSRKPGTFAPGQSGNPGGRPKESTEVTVLAKEHSLEAIRRLLELMRQNDDRKLAKAAADSILDRGLGKPAQYVAANNTDLTHEEWLASLQ